MRRLLTVLIGFLMGGWASLASATSFTFTTLDDPLGVGGTYPAAINNAGQVVGDYVDGNGNEEPFLYSGGTFSNLAIPASAGNPVGINNSGQILLGSNQQSSGTIDSGGALTPIRADPNAGGRDCGPPQNPGGAFCVYSYAYGFNASDQIVGTFISVNSGYYGFLDNNGSFVTVGPSAEYDDATGINDNGLIVGYYGIGEGVYGFVDSGGTLTTVNDPAAFDGEDTLALAINNPGQIVGGYGTSSAGGANAFLDTNGTFTDIIDPLASGFTWARGINDAGEVVGYYDDASGSSHGFLATPNVASPEPSTLLLVFAAVITIGIVSRDASRPR